MKKLFCAAVFLVLSLTTVSTFGAGFQTYPGASLDQRATDDANEMAKKANMSSRTKVFTTSDSFDKVAAFYKKIGKEYTMPSGSGKGFQMTFFLFDDGQDIVSSKLWAKIQRPAMGLYKEDVPERKTRDITVIILVEK